jgi:hypothetical protein
MIHPDDNGRTMASNAQPPPLVLPPAVIIAGTPRLVIRRWTFEDESANRGFSGCLVSIDGGLASWALSTVRGLHT